MVEHRPHNSVSGDPRLAGDTAVRLFDSFTPRQKAVLQHITNGDTYAKAGADMNISPKTVNAFIQQIRGKMNDEVGKENTERMLTSLVRHGVKSGKLEHEAPYGPYEYLTPAEFAICEQIYKGMTYQEIAADLFISIRTLESHMRNIRGKIQAKERGTRLHIVARLEHMNNEGILNEYRKKSGVLHGPYEYLTPGEFEVGNLIREGKGRAEIITMLRIGENDYYAHLARIKRKLQISGRADTEGVEQLNHLKNSNLLHVNDRRRMRKSKA